MHMGHDECTELEYSPLKDRGAGERLVEPENSTFLTLSLGIANIMIFYCYHDVEKYCEKHMGTLINSLNLIVSFLFFARCIICY